MQIFELVPNLVASSSPGSLNGGGDLEHSQIMVDRTELVALLGQRCADLLLMGFGADPPQDTEAPGFANGVGKRVARVVETWTRAVEQLIPPSPTISPSLSGGGNWAKVRMKPKTAPRTSGEGEADLIGAPIGCCGGPGGAPAPSSSPLRATSISRGSELV